MDGKKHDKINYHDAFTEIVEDSGFERERLPADDRVGQGETDEKWLEGVQPDAGRHAEAHRRDAEGPGGPLGDGVRDRLLHAHGAAVSAGTQGFMGVNVSQSSAPMTSSEARLDKSPVLPESVLVIKRRPLGWKVVGLDPLPGHSLLGTQHQQLPFGGSTTA